MRPETYGRRSEMHVFLEKVRFCLKLVPGEASSLCSLLYQALNRPKSFSIYIGMQGCLLLAAGDVYVDLIN